MSHLSRVNWIYAIVNIPIQINTITIRLFVSMPFEIAQIETISSPSHFPSSYRSKQSQTQDPHVQFHLLPPSYSLLSSPTLSSSSLLEQEVEQGRHHWSCCGCWTSHVVDLSECQSLLFPSTMAHQAWHTLTLGAWDWAPRSPRRCSCVLSPRAGRL